MAMGSEFLFVYGTLRRGAGTSWSRFLASAATAVGLGRTRGVMFQLDGYPGIVESTSDLDWVTGEVFRLDDAPSAWPILDEYEGCGPADPLPHEFERKIVQIKMDDGGRLNAWAYFYCLDTSSRARVLSGDYLQSIRSSM
jgi:gamma-glutamylcyclotransferase (GGCT)/AIG2-like uncharacterized protein YtfP